MARYTDTEALIEAIKNELWDWDSLDGITSATVLKQTITDIQNAPTADVVPVVRCKDCKWYGRADKRRFYRGMDCLQHRIDTIVPDKDFCSRGERRA